MLPAHRPVPNLDNLPSAPKKASVEARAIERIARSMVHPMPAAMNSHLSRINSKSKSIALIVTPKTVISRPLKASNIQGNEHNPGDIDANLEPKIPALLQFIDEIGLVDFVDRWLARGSLQLCSIQFLKLQKKIRGALVASTTNHPLRSKTKPVTNYYSGKRSTVVW